MAITLAHTFVSAKSQGADATLVSKNEWNAAHSLTMETGKLLGRISSSAGTVEEIDPSLSDFLIMRVSDADATGADVLTAQQVFPVNGAVTVAASTAYLFDAFYHITRSAGSNSHTTSTLFGGDATFTNIRYLAQSTTIPGNNGSGGNLLAVGVATQTALETSSSTTENLYIKLNGVMRINAGGTIIPQFKYSSQPGGAPTIKANSYFRMQKIGTDTFTSNGAWS